MVGERGPQSLSIRGQDATSTVIPRSGFTNNWTRAG